MIDAERVNELMISSLYKREECPGNEPPEEAIKVDGIMLTVFFHPFRLVANREEIREMVRQLPDQFHEEKGGGWSFLNMCVLRDGTQWTGEHSVMEALLCMAVGLGYMKILLKREMWAAFPGGLPYVMVTKEAA